MKNSVLTPDVISSEDFISFTETLSLIMRDAPYIQPNYDRFISLNGSMAFLSVARDWAFEFEKNTCVDDSLDWDENVWKFLLNKMNEF